jgi:rubredoxin
MAEVDTNKWHELGFSSAASMRYFTLRERMLCPMCESKRWHRLPEHFECNDCGTRFHLNEETGGTFTVLSTSTFTYVHPHHS